MKFAASICVLTFVLAVNGLTAQAQSTLNFPRLFPPAQMQSTGFAVANPSSSEATVTFTLYNDLGVMIASASQIVPPGGQLARLGSELFANAATPGWVQATSSAPGLTGFWLSGDFATQTDGAEAALAATVMVLPVVTAQTEISIANTSTEANNVSIRLVDANGADLVPPLTRNLPTLGAYQAEASAAFPGIDFTQAMYVHLSGDLPFTATSVVRGFLVPTESAVLNGVETSISGSSLHFAHVVSGAVGGADYATVLGVTNLAAAAQTVTLSFNPEPSGTPITVQRNLPPGGSLRDTAQNLFSLGSGFVDGWVRVSGPQSITGFLAYGDRVSGGLAVVPPQPTARASMLFAHVAGEPTWYTGIALLNASDANATVEISVLNAAGAPVGTTVTLSVGSKHKMARLLGELVPQARAQNGGFVIVRSSVPLFGLQLFGGAGGRVLSNIASGRPAASAPGTAPAPTLSATSFGRLTLDRVELDDRHPHGCTGTEACAVPATGNRVIRVRFNLFDITAAQTVQLPPLELLGLLTATSVSGSNFTPVGPFLLGAVQGPPELIDASITVSGITIATHAAAASPPYNVVYLGFEIPMNGTGLKFNWQGNASLDLGL